MYYMKNMISIYVCAYKFAVDVTENKKKWAYTRIKNKKRLSVF